MKITITDAVLRRTAKTFSHGNSTGPAKRLARIRTLLLRNNTKPNTDSPS